jgi:hypothetical protein
MTNQTTRRAILAGAAALPVTTVANALPASRDQAEQRLFELEREADKLRQQAEAAGELSYEAEHAMIAWNKRNPKPEMREASFPENKNTILARKVRGALEGVVHPDQAAVIGRMAEAWYDPANDDPNVDLKAAINEHGCALTAWKAREQAARNACGYDTRQAAFNELVDRMDEPRLEAAGIKTATMEGLRVKARLINSDSLSDAAHELTHSLLEDLLAWPASV